MSTPSVEDVLGASPLSGHAGLRWRPGLPTVASPMRQAVDAANWIVEADGIAPLFLKVYEADALEPLDLPAVFTATQAAADLGLGPAARFVDAERSALAVTALEAPWRPAFLDDLADPAVFEAAIAAKRRFNDAPPLPRRWDVFARIEERLGIAKGRSVPLPNDIEALAAWSREAAQAIDAAGLDLRPCHNDGSASAFMVDAAHHVRLVDFDAAGQSDPLYDLALVLNEASAFGDPWARGVELHAGRAEPKLVDRCRIYAAADDILWGLWGWTMSATSPRRGVEFLKYGEWRLLRARMALGEPGFADRLRGLRGRLP